MRLMPGHYSAPKPVRVKGAVPGQAAHISAPLKGLNLSSALTVADPYTASILDNWIVEEDRISCRPGIKLRQTLPVAVPIETIIPYYGTTQNIALATATTIYNQDNSVLETGFTSGNWAWTAFSNLSDTEFTVVVNGAQGVWSWDGTPTAAGFIKETVTAPVGATHIVPDNFHTVLSHMNRLWFADRSNLAVYYLPLQQKDGEVAELPLNAIFKRGGNIQAIYSWTVDGGMGLEDKLCIFTTNGEVAIYTGFDPDSNFDLVGVFKFDTPLGMQNFGGDLFAMISTGLLPMTTLLRAESEKLGRYDYSVRTAFEEVTSLYRNRRGWQTFLDHHTGLVVCNMPLGATNQYKQMVRRMDGQVWTSWSGLPSRSWQWINDGLVLGSDDGKLYDFADIHLSDDGKPIRCDVQTSWRNFGTSSKKQFKMILPYIITDGVPRPYVGMRFDYNSSALVNQPDTSGGTTGAEWDLADWDTADWAGSDRNVLNYQGVASGTHIVGAARLTVSVSNCRFAIAGWDVLFEKGSFI